MGVWGHFYFMWVRASAERKSKGLEEGGIGGQWGPGGTERGCSEVSRETPLSQSRLSWSQ